MEPETLNGFDQQNQSLFQGMDFLDFNNFTNGFDKVAPFQNPQKPNQFTQLSSPEFARSNNYTLMSDNDDVKVYTDQENEDYILLDTVTVYKNRTIKYLDGVKVSFFISGDGAKLLRQFDEVVPDSDELLVFLEKNDKHNLFGSIMRMNPGSDLKNKKDLPLKEMFEYSKFRQVNISQKDIEKLIKESAYSSKPTFFLWLINAITGALDEIFSFFGEDVFDNLGSFFGDTLGNGIAGLKVAENRWNPDVEDGKFDPLFLPVSKQSLAGFLKPFGKKISETEKFFTDFLESIAQFFPKIIYKKAKSAFDFLFKQLYKAADWLSNPESGLQFIYRIGQSANAFLCGLLNSIIDIIAGVFQLIGMIFKGISGAIDRVSNAMYYGALFAEILENIIETVRKADFVDFIAQAVSFQLKTLKRVYESLSKVLGIDVEKICYYYGYIIGIVIETLLEIFFTGGSATAAKWSGKLAEMGQKSLSKITTFVKQAVSKTKDLLMQVVEFIEFLMARIKKGAKYLFDELSKLLDEIFGAGKKVTALPKTKAEQRVAAKKEAKDKKLSVKENKKRLDDFKKKCKGKSLASLKRSEIANALKGYTEQANKIAKLIDDEILEFEILDDLDFERILTDAGDTIEEAAGTIAFCIGNKTYYRASRPAEQLLSEFVHEGTHALDFLNNFTGDTYQWEKRAFFHERAFQESIGMEKDFDTIGQMLKYIYKNY